MWHQTIISKSNPPSEDEKKDTINQFENSSESTQYQTTFEPNINPIEITQQNQLQIHGSFYSDIFTEQTPSLSLEQQRKISEVTSLELTQAEIQRLKLQHQKRTETANQKLRKQEPERNDIFSTLESTLHSRSRWL